MNNEDSEEMKK